jgi:hypothetical protein
LPHIPAAERIAADDPSYKDDRIVHVTASPFRRLWAEGSIGCG